MWHGGALPAGLELLSLSRPSHSCRLELMTYSCPHYPPSPSLSRTVQLPTFPPSLSRTPPRPLQDAWREAVPTLSPRQKSDHSPVPPPQNGTQLLAAVPGLDKVVNVTSITAAASIDSSDATPGMVPIIPTWPPHGPPSQKLPLLPVTVLAIGPI